eukprot:1154368-Pelagomonas_calceolata.AAC.3
MGVKTPGRIAHFITNPSLQNPASKRVVRSPRWPEDEHARRLASWLFGTQVSIICSSAGAQTAVVQYLHTLPPSQRPACSTSVLSLDMLSNATPLGQPPLAAEFPSAVYLASCFRVKPQVPDTDNTHKRLLRAVLHNIVMLPTLDVAQNYRTRVGVWLVNQAARVVLCIMRLSVCLLCTPSSYRLRLGVVLAWGRGAVSCAV